MGALVALMRGTFQHYLRYAMVTRYALLSTCRVDTIYSGVSISVKVEVLFCYLRAAVARSLHHIMHAMPSGHISHVEWNLAIGPSWVGGGGTCSDPV